MSNRPSRSTIASSRRALIVPAAAIIAFLCLSCSGAPSSAGLGGTWVTAIRSSNQWAVFPCKDYLVTNVCGTDKDYSDPGSLPPVIMVGDTINYLDKNGKSKRFAVRHINYFAYDKDVDFMYGGKRYTAKKGDTTCTLYDIKSRSATAESAYPSRLVVSGCNIPR